jgi:cobyrinic acid a,c-diamide synthase
VERAADSGLPVYAECGGAVFLGEGLFYEGRSFDMAGVLPVVFSFQRRPRGHGYVVLDTVAENPFFAVGDSIRGHEFHYTFVETSSATDHNFAFRVQRGYGFDGTKDGLCHRNVLACYTHVHALGEKRWAPALVRAARRYREGR